MTRLRHVILDRDGVLNREAPGGGHILSPAGWHWLPGALEALRRLKEAGMRISVATNQSAVGRGLMTLADLEAIHMRMLAEASAAGGAIDAVFFCPHAPDAGCTCRKPAPGMVEAALRAASVGPGETVLVGDADRDLQAARAAGVPAVLVRTGKGAFVAAQLGENDAPVFDDLLAFARQVAKDVE